MSKNCEVYEKRVEEDIHRAIALSLETYEFEKLQSNEKMKHTKELVRNPNISLDLNFWDAKKEQEKRYNVGKRSSKPDSKQQAIESEAKNEVNLIDFSVDDRFETKKRIDNVLENFDPLLTLSESYEECVSTESNSIYNEYDPLEYLYSNGSDCSRQSEYQDVAADQKSPCSRPESVKRSSTRAPHFLEYADQPIRIILCDNRYDKEIAAFFETLQSIRLRLRFDDPLTNGAIVINRKINNLYKNSKAIDVHIDVMESLFAKPDNVQRSKLSIACDISSTIEHIILNAIYELDLPESRNYIFKIRDSNEYLESDAKLSDYEYIHNCLKLDMKINLSLVCEDSIDSSLKRTSVDDKKAEGYRLANLLREKFPGKKICNSLSIVLETFENEIGKIKKSVSSSFCHYPPTNHLSSFSVIVQSVKAICINFDSIETLEIHESLKSFKNVYDRCRDIDSENRFAKNDNLHELIHLECNRLRNSLKSFLRIASKFFRADFKVAVENEQQAKQNQMVVKQIFEVNEIFRIKVFSIHKLLDLWNYDDYYVSAQIFHGTRPISSAKTSKLLKKTIGLFQCYFLIADQEIEFEDVCICLLPREARCVLTLFGCNSKNDFEQQQQHQQQQQQQQEVEPQQQQQNDYCKKEENELAWSALQLFDFKGKMQTKDSLLVMWPCSISRIILPVSSNSSSPFLNSPVMHVSVCYSGKVQYSSSVCTSTSSTSSNAAASASGNYRKNADFSSLDQNTQQQLLEIVNQDTLSKVPVEDREILWEKRHYLHKIPEALPKVLLAAHSWNWACLKDLHNMIRNWSPMTPSQALQLLLPCFPDTAVRKLAISCLQEVQDDELFDYLPQLIQSIQYETYLTSPLFGFLFERALKSLKIAHYLYWFLNNNVTHNCSVDFSCDSSLALLAKFSTRTDLLSTIFMNMCSNKLRECLITQKFLMMQLDGVAKHVKESKENFRLKSIAAKLEDINQSLIENPTSLPLSLSSRVSGIHIKSCNYFTSRTLPLQINFVDGCCGKIVPTIFKSGDDLRQDMLILQIVNIINKMWLSEGLDLQMITFMCMSTSYMQGIMELVTNAETLRKIQIEYGVTGSFKDKPIAEWLAKQNCSETDFRKACENFTASCAGYSVVTYILGIGDRHNDNIMVKNSGHLFHIDFGKFFGDTEKFGNFKRDRAPFVLSSDMVYVINGGDKSSARFHYFVDLCCHAFNVIRKNRNVILHLLTLMVSTGINGVTMQAVDYVHRALLPHQSSAEAAAAFSRLIQSAIKSRFTQFNFFIHNLSQMRYASDNQSTGDLLSFVSKTHNALRDGRIKSVEILGCQKRYDPEKYYLYIIKVERQTSTGTAATAPGTATPNAIATAITSTRLPSHEILRTYKEFCEFHQKLCLLFPLAKMHSLSSGLQIGRSNVQNTAQKRLIDLRKFVKSLFETCDEIAHSDLVYTFFHPLIRDEKPEARVPFKAVSFSSDEKSKRSIIQGEIKISINYSHNMLFVMVYHVRGLPLVNGAQPSTYVKVYLRPDPLKITKRKTKLIRKNCFPSFMEMLEYRMPLDIVRNRLLQATVWSHDIFQENEFLGGVSLELNQFDLKSEIIDWFPLKNITQQFCV